MAKIPKKGPWNPQKATAYVGKGVLQNGDTLSPIKGSISPVSNGPLIKKKGVFKGSTLKNGGNMATKKKLAPAKKAAPVMPQMAQGPMMKSGGKKCMNCGGKMKKK